MFIIHLYHDNEIWEYIVPFASSSCWSKRSRQSCVAMVVIVVTTFLFSAEHFSALLLWYILKESYSEIVFIKSILITKEENDQNNIVMISIQLLCVQRTYSVRCQLFFQCVTVYFKSGLGFGSCL